MSCQLLLCFFGDGLHVKQGNFIVHYTQVTAVSFTVEFISKYRVKISAEIAKIVEVGWIPSSPAGICIYWDENVM